MASRNPILDVPLTTVMRPQIALPLRHVLQVYTVGNFLSAWRNPKTQKTMEQLFDSPEQARHAAATCAAWLGIRTPATHKVAGPWWPDERIAAGA